MRLLGLGLPTRTRAIESNQVRPTPHGQTLSERGACPRYFSITNQKRRVEHVPQKLMADASCAELCHWNAGRGEGGLLKRYAARQLRFTCHGNSSGRSTVRGCWPLHIRWSRQSHWKAFRESCGKQRGASRGYGTLRGQSRLHSNG